MLETVQIAIYKLPVYEISPAAGAPRHDPALPIRGYEFVLRHGRTAASAGTPRARGGGGAGAGGDHLLHRGEHRGQADRHQDRHAHLGGPGHLPGASRAVSCGARAPGTVRGGA